ncbi:MAG: Maf family nucleotide pyrophosphatase [Bacteroidota bacterium]
MTENPLAEKLKNHKVILASASPRRKKFFEELGINFEIRLKPINETYPKDLKAEEISTYLAKLKASGFEKTLKPNEILITSDTVVWWKGESLEKATKAEEAVVMLKKLSGDWHQVITSVCFTTAVNQTTLSCITRVKFKSLTEGEIAYYVRIFKPFDKAGAYGIQEWLGTIAIEEIEGSYNNVVGLPTHLVYKVLNEF